MKTKISFSHKQLRVIEQSLEAFSRARLGQFKNWFEETFKWKFSGEVGSDIEQFTRLRILQADLEKKHGSLVRSTIGKFMGESKVYSTRSFLSRYWQALQHFDREESESFPRELNGSWGISQPECGEEAHIAYEVSSTLRQYRFVSENGGFFKFANRSFDEPLEISDEDLPEIEGFVKYKDYHIDEADSKQLHAFIEDKNWVSAWGYVDTVLRPKYSIPLSHTSSSIQGDNPYYIRVIKPLN
jgi:hypothetical protein